MRRTLAMLLATTMLSACVQPVGHQVSGIKTPADWLKQTTASQETPLMAAAKDAAIEHEWWRVFGDTVLDKLIEKAAQENHDLRIARARVEEAQAGRQSAMSALFPAVTATGDASRGNPGALFGNKPFSTLEARANASWELDLFGRNQARAAQAEALREAEEATRDGVMVGLFAEVARQYFELRNLQQQLDVIGKHRDAQRHTLEAITARNAAGIDSELELQQATAQLAQTESRIAPLQIAHDATMNRLNVLLGQTPGTLNALLVAAPLTALPSHEVVLAAPADVLANRPDVRAAERSYASTISGHDAALRDFFPRISLLSFFGAQELNDTSSNPWSLAAGLTQPVLNFGQLSAGLNAADARQKQAVANYQRTVLTALEDMENALSAYANAHARYATVQTSYASSQKALEIAKARMAQGEIDVLDVLTAERAALETASELATADAQLRQVLAAIYAAAGGGWKYAPPAVPANADQA